MSVVGLLGWVLARASVVALVVSLLGWIVTVLGPLGGGFRRVVWLGFEGGFGFGDELNGT